MELDAQLMRKRFELLGEPTWPIGEVIDHYGFDHAAVISIAGRVAETAQGELMIDRWAFERAISEARWLSPRLAAAELCLTEDSVRWLMEWAGKPDTAMANIPRMPTRQIAGQTVLLGSMLSGWVQEATGFRGVWSSITRRAERLRGALKDPARAMGRAQGLEPLLDSVAETFAARAPALFSDEPTLAWAWCAVSRQPISPAHAEILWLTSRGKPVSLDPDRVGWHVLMKCPELRAHVIGSQETFLALEDALRHPQGVHVQVG